MIAIETEPKAPVARFVLQLLRDSLMIRNITLSELEAMKKRGFELLSGCDAGKANSDGFVVMVKRVDGKPCEIAIVCPTFLRGPLRFTKTGSVSY